MSCDLEVTNDSARCWEKIFSFITKKQLCYPRELFLSNVVLSKSIYMHNSWKRFTENSLGSPWSELGKQNIQAKDLFTWRWRSSGSWGNPLRSGNRPVHMISHFNGPYAWLRQTSKFHHQASFARKILCIYTLCTWVFFSNLLPWDILLCKTSQLYNSKRGLVEKFAHLT